MILPLLTLRTEGILEYDNKVIPKTQIISPKMWTKKQNSFVTDSIVIIVIFTD